MASTPYLKNNLDSLQTLPVELYQNLTRMRDFNSRTQEVMCNIDKQSDDYLSNAKGYTAHKEGETLSNIKHQFKKEKEYVDDKVKLSIQTYELVDKYIKKLDSEFERFVADIEGRAIRTKINLEENSQQQGLKNIQDQEIKKMSASSEGETAPIKTSTKKHAKKKGVTKTTSTVPSKTPLNNIFTKATNPKKSVTSVTVETSSLTGGLIGAGVAHSAEVLDMPVDPNEPTYCLCNQVSYGKMIACDNPDCPIEWFHFKCVKLTTNPKGKWFCPKCITDKKKKKTQYIKN